MKKEMTVAFALLLFAASFATALAQNTGAGAGNGPEAAGNGPNGAGSMVISPAPISSQIRERIRTETQKTYENGTKVIAVTNAGRYSLNKTVTVVNSTYKLVQVDTPKGSISVEVAGRTPAEVTRNGEFVKRLSEEFENCTGIDRVEMDPVRNRVRAMVRNETDEEEEIGIPETLRTHVRARIQDKPVNVTLDSEKKEIVLTSEQASAITKEKIEIDNETVYLVTEKVRKGVHVLPENASETAKLRANFHLVKAIELVEEDGAVLYRLQGRQIGKILGLFPTEVEVGSDVDAETGEVKSISRPWWSFLVF
jgi:hypothetical protein